ncbi:MAG: hypothetical protein AAF569_08840 [Pseudomonadota bacterium]
MRLFITTFIALIGFCNPAKADVVNLNGLYETQHENAMIVPLDEGEKCEGPNRFLHDNGMCVEPFTSANHLGFLLNDDSSLDFLISLSFFNGHTCYMRKEAQKVENGWQYSETLPDNMGTCLLDITIEDQDIVVNTPEGSKCKNYYCGARGYLNDIRFPILSKVREISEKGSLDCIGVISDDCKGAIQPE